MVLGSGALGFRALEFRGFSGLRLYSLRVLGVHFRGLGFMALEFKGFRDWDAWELRVWESVYRV